MRSQEPFINDQQQFVDDGFFVPPNYDRNYFKGALDNVGGLKYRLDGRDVINDVCDTLAGITKINGKRVVIPDYRLMNDVGVNAARFFLQGFNDKITHLSKFKNETRVLRQIREIVVAWIKEVTLHMKDWAPPGKPKVINKRLVIQIIENKALQSMLRADDGFENQNISSSHNIHEMIDNKRQAEKVGFFNSLFGGRE